MKCNNCIALIRVTLTFFLIAAVYFSEAQHIQYRDKKKPVATTTPPAENSPVPVPDRTVKVIPVDPIAKPVVIKEDTSSRSLIKTKAAFTLNPRPKKPYVEEQNMCDLMSKPEVAPTLPLIINNVSPEMVKILKERYKGRLYSITGLNMMDVRLKYKLKICDKDQAKFRSEYLDQDGKVVNDPDFDYY
jgi:hypothetical protein